MGLSGGQPRRRLGVFGGAFDPPHMAHVALAQAAVDQLRLDALYVVPTGQAWHKTRALTPASHRLAMAQLAFGDLPKVDVSDVELLRHGPSYTVDTLHDFQARGPNAQWFLVMGEDQAQALNRWHRADEIVKLAIISIARRAEKTRAEAEFDPKTLHGAVWEPILLPLMPTSSTAVRQRIADGEGTDRLVPDAVARYIDQHQLYQTTR